MMDFVKIKSEDELYHWGIKGQKWGIRRFQNKDGTLTDKGKKRYKDDKTQTSNKKYKLISSPGYKHPYIELKSGDKVFVNKSATDSEIDNLIKNHQGLRESDKKALGFGKSTSKKAVSKGEEEMSKWLDKTLDSLPDNGSLTKKQADELDRLISKLEKEDIYHSGIKGMKWGVRRYQNSDGSLTPAGKKRYGNESEDHAEMRVTKQKKVSEMSNKELQAANKRMELENNYKRLNKSSSRGRQAVKSYIALAGTITAAAAATATYVKYGRQAASTLTKIGKIVLK